MIHKAEELPPRKKDDPHEQRFFPRPSVPLPRASCAVKGALLELVSYASVSSTLITVLGTKGSKLGAVEIVDTFELDRPGFKSISATCL